MFRIPAAPWAFGALGGRLLWSLTANALASITMLASALLTARWLGTEAFGRLALLVSAQAVLMTLVASSLGQVATKLTAELRIVDPERLAAVRALLQLSLRVIAALVLVLGLSAPAFVREALLGRGTSVMLSRLALPSLLFAVAASLQQGYIAGLGAFRELAYINGARLVVTVAALFAFTRDYGLQGAVAALGVAGAVTWMGGEFVLRRHHPVRRERISVRVAGGEIGVLADFALPSWLSGALFAAAAWFGNVLLSRCPDGLLYVGTYNVASQIGRSALLLAPNALAAPFLVEIAARLGTGESGPALSLVRRSLVLMASTALVPAVFTALFGRQVISLYGPGFAQAYPVLLVVLVTTVLAALSLSANTTLLAFGDAWSVTLVTGLWTIVFLAMLRQGPVSGAMTLAVAYLVAYMAQLLLTVPLAVRAISRKAV